jgi:hypothetical protein
VHRRGRVEFGEAEKRADQRAGDNAADQDEEVRERCATFFGSGHFEILAFGAAGVKLVLTG